MKAKANEFLYYKLKELGLVSQMDVDIGLEFLDIQATLGTRSNDSVTLSERDMEST